MNDSEQRLTKKARIRLSEINITKIYERIRNVEIELMELRDSLLKLEEVVKSNEEETNDGR